MVVSRRDDAISEIIGFVLIIALIAIVASLYLTYVVPAQGRDMEIAHMDVIQDQFMNYKTTVDSLWINDRYNTQISSPFTLGTNPGSTQGSFVNLPLFQPVTSGGTMVVNGQTDTISVTASAQYTQGNPTQAMTPTTNPDIQIEPEHLFVSFSTNNINNTYAANIEPTSGKGNWRVLLNTTPGQQTPLTMTVIKNGTPSISNLVIQKSIANYTSYQIDLADSVYGLKDAFQYPFNLVITPADSTVTRTGSSSVSYENPVGVIIPQGTDMGSLEYRSSNNYWITQNYIYQYGGIFLQQPQDNGSMVKLLPSISVTRDSKNKNLARVTIHGITIPDTIPSRVGGSSLVQVLTTLKKPDAASNNLVNSHEYGVANTKNVTITVNAGDGLSADMWYYAFRKIREQSDAKDWIPSIEPPSGNIVIMRIGNNPPNNYNVVLDVQSSVADLELSPTSYYMQS